MFEKKAFDAFKVTHYLNGSDVVIHKDEYKGHSPVNEGSVYHERGALTIIYLTKMDKTKTRVAVKESPEEVTKRAQLCGIKIAGGDK